MSVSDPLLKSLKNYVLGLRMTSGSITDSHEALQPFCQILELILRKGIKQSASMFELSRRRDYWHWIDQLAMCNNREFKHVSKPAKFDMIVQQVNKTGKITTVQGRGRYFIREALQSKLLVTLIDLLADSSSLIFSFYDPNKSILADEILFEIFKSLLLQTVEMNFDLCLANHSFLDDTWKLSIYKEIEMVPCSDIGMRLLHINGRVVVTAVTKGSVAEATNEIDVGDVLDDLFDRALRNIVKGSIPKLLKRHSGQPIALSIVKFHDADGCTYPPIGELVKLAGLNVAYGDSSIATQSKKPPPHALLPEDIADEIPVHGATDRANYDVQFVGKVHIGENGGTDNVEPAILKLIGDDSKLAPKDIVMELSETEIVIKDRGSDEVRMTVSYTEISSCGRRPDHAEYFAFIAGETTCTLAKDFVAYIFKAISADESNFIICSIAQGFSRTHWFV